MTQPMSAVHQKTSSSLRSKTCLVVDVDLGEVAAGGVDDPLRLPGGARGVEDEEQVLGVHRLRPARRRLASQQLVPPVVAALGHLGERLVALAAGRRRTTMHVLDRGRLGHRLRRPSA